MRIVYAYSHLAAADLLAEQFPDIDLSIAEAVAATGSDFRTRLSRERRRRGQTLYDPTAMNAAFRREFGARGFRELRRRIELNVPNWDASDIRAGRKQIDFVRDRVFVEVQLGVYPGMFYDLVKMNYFNEIGEADVGVEIVPSYRLQRQMSSGVGRGEMLVTDIMGLQRQFPTFPVKIIFIEP